MSKFWFYIRELVDAICKRLRLHGSSTTEHAADETLVPPEDGAE